MNKKLLVLLAFASLVAVPFFAHGASFKVGDSYYLAPNLTIDDNLYTAGADITIAGTLNGDVLATGGNINISGAVQGDVAAAGGTININNSVAGDIRVAGGTINIFNSSGGDLIIAGGQINVGPDSSSGGDVKIFGGKVSYLGKASKTLNIKAGSAYIDGTIVGDVAIEAEQVELGPNAVIQGNFDYSALKEATIKQGAQVEGLTNFTKIDIKKGSETKGVAFSIFSIAWLIKILMMITAGIVIFYMFKQATNQIVDKSGHKFWKQALIGFIVLIIVPVAVVLSFITVIGALLGIILLFMYIALMMIAGILTSLLFARLTLKYIFKKEAYELNWWIIIIAVLVLGIISIIPFVGWIFTFIIFLSALGSVSSYFYRSLRKGDINKH